MGVFSPGDDGFFMDMRGRLYIILLLLLGFATAMLPGGEARIVFTSDLHGGIRNFAALVPAIRKHTNERTVALDLGDTVMGGFDAEYAENSTGMAQALNRAGIHYWVPGNHDFELPDANFRDFVKCFRGTALGGDWSKAGVTGQPFAIIETGGVRLAVIGLTDPKMPRRMLPGAAMAFRDPRQVLREVLPEVRKRRPHLIVLAWHNGLYSVAGPLGKFLKEFPEIGLVLGAHSHHENPGERVGNTLYVQAGAHGHAAGVVDIATGDTGGVKLTSFLIRGDALGPDPETAALARRLRDGCRGVYHRKLGNFSPPLKQVGREEYGSQLGGLCAEALRRCAGADAGVVWMPVTDIPFLKRGVRCYGELYRILDHRDEVCSLVVTKAELSAFLREQRKLDRKLKRECVLFAAGIKLHRSPRGEVSKIDAPETFRLAVSAYRIAESRVLRPLVGHADRAFRRTGVIERDAAALFLAEPNGHDPQKYHRERK